MYGWREMPTHQRILTRKLEEFKSSLQHRQISEKTIREYCRIVRFVDREMEQRGQKFKPRTIDAQVIQDLIFNILPGKPSTKRGYLSGIRAYLEFNGNYVMREMDLRWPPDMRINVDWLDLEQSVIVLNSCRSPLEEMIVHLELLLGYRRIEVKRAKISDFKERSVRVHGKGRFGGKIRTIPLHPNTWKVLTSYLEYRQSLIKENISRGHLLKDSGQLVVYMRSGETRSFQDTALDNIIKRISGRCGIHFRHHTLRRTFGRNLWKAGVPIETIALMMGHEDMKTTVSYLGIRLDDMDQAMGMYQKYLQSALPENQE